MRDTRYVRFNFNKMLRPNSGIPYKRRCERSCYSNCMKTWFIIAVIQTTQVFIKIKLEKKFRAECKGCEHITSAIYRFAGDRRTSKAFYIYCTRFLNFLKRPSYCVNLKWSDFLSVSIIFACSFLRSSETSFPLSDSKADSRHLSFHRRDFDDENNFSGNYKGEDIDGRLSNFVICLVPLLTLKRGELLKERFHWWKPEWSS